MYSHLTFVGYEMKIVKRVAKIINKRIDGLKLMVFLVNARIYFEQFDFDQSTYFLTALFCERTFSVAVKCIASRTYEKCIQKGLKGYSQLTRITKWPKYENTICVALVFTSGVSLRAKGLVKMKSTVVASRPVPTHSGNT